MCLIQEYTGFSAKIMSRRGASYTQTFTVITTLLSVKSEENKEIMHKLKIKMSEKQRPLLLAAPPKEIIVSIWRV